MTIVFNRDISVIIYVHNYIDSFSADVVLRRNHSNLVVQDELLYAGIRQEGDVILQAGNHDDCERVTKQQ